MADPGFVGDFSFAGNGAKHIIALAYALLNDRHDMLKLLPARHPLGSFLLGG
jgi:hypothetical protein